MELTPIINKLTGSVILISLIAGEKYAPFKSAFDRFIMIVSGKVKISIDKKTYNLNAGDCIIVPANKHHVINAPVACQVNLTIFISS